MADILTATSMVPLRIYGQLPTTADEIYTAAAGTGAILMTGSLENASGSPVQVSLAIVKSGDSGGDTNWIFNDFSLPSGPPLDLGALGPLDEGDFIWVEAGTASAVTLNIGGFKFSSTTTGTPAGINLDAVTNGSEGRGTTSPETTTIPVGTGANLDLLAFVAVGHSASVDTTTGQFGYDTLSVSSSLDGAMTRLVSAWAGSSASVATGTVHIFGYAAPSSGSHTLTATVSKAGVTLGAIQVAAESWTGVASRSGATAFNGNAAALLNAALTSASGKRAVLAAAFGQFAPTDFNQQIRYQNGPTGDVGGVGEHLVLGDAPGASSVAFTVGGSAQFNCAAGINLDAA